MQLQELVGSQPALKRLAEREDLPGALTWKVAQAARAIEDHLKSYEETRGKLVKQYGVEGEQGQWAVDINDKKAYGAFLEELNKVLQQDVKVKTQIIKSKELDEVKISAKDLIDLGWLIQ